MAKTYRVFGEDDGELVEMAFVPAVMPNQADSTATAVADLKTNFNQLLKKLQDAGYMAKGS